jgi:hypothetical protein
MLRAVVGLFIVPTDPVEDCRIELTFGLLEHEGFSGTEIASLCTFPYVFALAPTSRTIGSKDFTRCRSNNEQ